MDTDKEERLNLLTEKIIGCAFRVSNELGCGLLEKVYENAMVYELRKNGLFVEQQRRFKVFYDGMEVGEYVADLVVERTVLLELKAIKNFDDSHSAQCINLLAITKLLACLMMNFAKPKIEIKRFRGPG
jgi:GxxExxY protein